ncbi:MAG TPA: helix-turn-helix transcriptional regulator [Thermoanaerobaculia bacterium]|nr:helix-turn-helix transcriptional regulator [Thermoanaerobaculia bacterium]
MPKAPLPDLAIALTFIRSGQGWSLTEFGEAASTSPTLLNDYEHGRKALKRDRLDYLISFMGVPPEAVDGTLEQLEANRAASRAPKDSFGRASESRRRIEAVTAKTGKLATGFARSLMTLLSLEGDALQERQRAQMLWARLKRHKPDDRLALVEDSAKFRTWALCELVAAKSIEAAPSSPAEALELAELALRIAQLCACDELLRWRAEGYAWFHVSNARRVTSDLPGADVAQATARRLWKAGAPGDPGYFNEAIVLGLEAELHRAQRRFPEASGKIEEALAADRGDLRGRLLLTKSQIFMTLGEIEHSTEVLREAIPFIDDDREPRTAFGIRFQFLVNLCLQEDAAEAAAGLSAVRALSEKLAQEIDSLRVVWLAGKVAAGTGQADAAEDAFEQVRRRFASQKPALAFDYALVSLDLALLLLRQDRTNEVKTLTEQMAWIFASQGIQREALAALRIFCDAAQREAATVGLARSVVRFLHRAQHDPELKFESGEEAAVP